MSGVGVDFSREGCLHMYLLCPLLHYATQRCSLICRPSGTLPTLPLSPRRPLYLPANNIRGVLQHILSRDYGAEPQAEGIPPTSATPSLGQRMNNNSCLHRATVLVLIPLAMSNCQSYLLGMPENEP